jgi:hypothetical protein
VCHTVLGDADMLAADPQRLNVRGGAIVLA